MILCGVFVDWTWVSWDAYEVIHCRIYYEYFAVTAVFHIHFVVSSVFEIAEFNTFSTSEMPFW